MRSKLTLLETRVARRMLGLFLLCAVLPVALVVVIAYHHVSGQLHRQSRDRMRDASKAVGMAIVERLQLIDAELRLAATALQSVSEVEAAVPEELVDPASRMTALSLARPGELPYRLSGKMDAAIPLLEPDQEDHLLDGGALLMVAGSATTPALLLARMLDPERPKRGILWADIDPTRLWAPFIDDGTPIELCLFAEGSTATLVCDRPGLVEMLPTLRAFPKEGDLEWTQDGERYSAGYWTATLDRRWMAQPWTIILSESRSQVLAPMAKFTRTFLLLMAIALVVVLFISNDRIRRGMEPLVRLQEGTTRVAQGKFSELVVVASGDEFEDLAGSFNTMTQRIGRQFTALTAINDIGRAALSQLTSDRMVNTILSRFSQIQPGAGVSLLLRGTNADDPWHVTTISPAGRTERDVRLSPGDLTLLAGAGETLIVPVRESHHPVLSAFSPLEDWARLLLLPLSHEGELMGVVTLASPVGQDISADDTTQARQLADQATVALANTRLMERLAQLSGGTLSALARTIDANSPWTAGHSERVTRLSLSIGRELALSARELDIIHRGGMMHDIGKIGIPSRLLDKPSRLTDAEMEIVRSHPVVGARILAPISIFQDIIPIVRHHHERFDGTGYPDRLAGTDIPLLARVVAVADVFDALVSSRPYRPGWTASAASRYILSTASAHHDPMIVQAFLALLARGEIGQDSIPPETDVAIEPIPALVGEEL